MNSTASVWLVLLLAVFLANLPFLNERLFAVGPRQQAKSVSWHLLELLLYCGLMIGLGRWLEGRHGQMVPQGWQFYAVLLCVMLTLAFPGFVWRHLRRSS
jgi:hypothetical protein